MPPPRHGSRRHSRGCRSAEHEAAGLPAGRRGKDVAAQVALARRESPRNGSRFVGLAEALVHEMPHTMAALAAGQLSEWRATLMVKETACLSREHRRQVDAELADRLGELSDRAVSAEARKVAYRLDPYSFVERSRKAEADRCVSLRPAPDCMTRLSALLPVAQGVAAFAALTRAADSARAGGEERGRGQLMADTPGRARHRSGSSRRGRGGDPVGHVGRDALRPPRRPRR